MKSLFLNPRSRSRVLTGHLWVFAGEVQSLLPDSENGKTVLLRDSRKRVLGSGIYNNQSKIVWRRFSMQRQAFSIGYIRQALEASIARRPEEACRRLVWSESDALPGLVVDQFEKVLVVQGAVAQISHLKLDTLVSFVILFPL